MKALVLEVEDGRSHQHETRFGLYLGQAIGALVGTYAQMHLDVPVVDEVPHVVLPPHKVLRLLRDPHVDCEVGHGGVVDDVRGSESW